MALQLRLPVVPIYLSGLFTIFSVHDDWPKAGPVRAVSGAPLHFEQRIRARLPAGPRLPAAGSGRREGRKPDAGKYWSERTSMGLDHLQSLEGCFSGQVALLATDHMPVGILLGNPFQQFDNIRFWVDH